MKLGKSPFFMMVFFLTGAVLFAAGSQEKEEKIELRYMHPHTAGSLQRDQIDLAVETFMNANPNVTVLQDSLPSRELRTKITVEMASGNPPNVAWNVLSYAREFMNDDKILDWSTVYSDPSYADFTNSFPKDLREFSMDEKGRIMMAPFELSYDGLFYNEELLNMYGWDPPETFDDFVAMAPLAREKGIHLIVAGGKDLRWAWLASALLVRTGGKANADMLALGDGSAKWTDRKYGFPQAMEKFQDLVQAGAYPDDILAFGTNEADQVFAQGKALFYFEGAWKPANFKNHGGDEFLAKMRRMDFPPMNDMPMGEPGYAVGGTIIGMIAAADQPEAARQASIDLVVQLSSKETWIPILESGTNMYASPYEFDQSNLSPAMVQMFEDFNSGPDGYIPSMDAYAPPAVDLAIKRDAMPGIISGDLSVEEACQLVQDAADEYYKSR